jgi:hypothetical protein
MRGYLRLDMVFGRPGSLVCECDKVLGWTDVIRGPGMSGRCAGAGILAGRIRRGAKKGRGNKKRKINWRGRLAKRKNIRIDCFNMISFAQ